MSKKSSILLPLAGLAGFIGLMLYWSKQKSKGLTKAAIDESAQHAQARAAEAMSRQTSAAIELTPLVILSPTKVKPPIAPVLLSTTIKPTELAPVVGARQIETREPYPLPEGWLGALVAYGVLVQGLYAERQKKLMQPHPDRIATLCDHNNNKYLWCRYHAEPPPPTVSLATAIGEMAATKATGERELAYVTMSGHYSSDMLAFFDNKGRLVSDIFKQHRAHLLSNLNLEFGRSGKNLLKDNYKDLQLDVHLPDQPGRVPTPAEVLSILKYDVRTKGMTDYQKLATYWSLCWQYYARARWIVWAAEVWRQHSKWDDSAPAWWRDYAVAWNVGCATASRCRDFEEGGTHNSWRVGGENTNNADLKPTTLIRTDYLLRRIMRAIPVPGAIMTGTETAPTRMANWPATLGDISPCIVTPAGWYQWCVTGDCKEEKKIADTVQKVFTIIGQVGFAVVGNVAGGWVGPMLQLAVSTLDRAATGGLNLRYVIQGVLIIAEAFGLQNAIKKWAPDLGGVQGEFGALINEVSRAYETAKKIPIEGYGEFAEFSGAAKARLEDKKRQLAEGLAEAPGWGMDNVKAFLGTL